MFKHFIHELHEERGDFDPRSCHGRHGGFFGGGRHWRGERGGFAGGRERLFEGGDLQLILLQLLAEKPSYGYELIKAIEERMAGGYAPSPGVIYPTLTLLEERGFARVEPTEGTRKVYAITEEGRAELERSAGRLREITERLEETGRGFRRGRSPEIMRAFMELRSAIRNRVTREGLTEEQIAKIADAVRQAAKNIDAL